MQVCPWLCVYVVIIYRPTEIYVLRITWTRRILVASRRLSNLSASFSSRRTSRRLDASFTQNAGSDLWSSHGHQATAPDCAPLVHSSRCLCVAIAAVSSCDVMVCPLGQKRARFGTDITVIRRWSLHGRIVDKRIGRHISAITETVHSCSNACSRLFKEKIRSPSRTWWSSNEASLQSVTLRLVSTTDLL